MDSKTVLGYYLASFNFLEGCLIYYVLFSFSVAFFISSSVYVDAFSEDFNAIINEISDEINFKKKKGSKSRARKNDASEKLTGAISLHYEMLKYFTILFFSLKSTLICVISFHYYFLLFRRFMDNIRNLSSGILFSALLSFVLFLTLNFFAFDQSSVINMTTIVNLAGFLTYLTLGYTYCYFSENITANSFKIGYDAYNSKWTEMTTREQKAIMLAIGRSQKEFRLSGLGLIDCSMMTFLSVII